MKHDDDFIGKLEGYLDEYEGTTPLPDAVRDAVRAKLPTTQQIRPDSGLMRNLTMDNNIVRAGLAAAALVVAVIIGGELFGNPNPGGTPTGSLAPSAPSAPSEPAAGPYDFTALPGEDVDLQPGDWVITYAAPVEVTITIPAEPYEDAPTAWQKAEYDWGPWHHSNGAALQVAQIENLSVDPCRPELGMRSPVVGPTVDDLATALGSVPYVDARPPTAATLAGYSGTFVELNGMGIPGDCAQDVAVLWETTKGDTTPIPDEGDRARIWILDVSGTRLVVKAMETEPGTVSLLKGLIESIRIDVP